MTRARAAVTTLLAGLLGLLTPAALADEPRVRLLFAIPGADDYLRVMQIVAHGQLTAIDGEAFVLVGDYADARQGHALGLALQSQLGLPFELVYDPQHPQADLSWMRDAERGVATARVPLPAPPAPPPPLEPTTLTPAPLTPPPPLPAALALAGSARQAGATGRAPAGSTAREPLVYLYAQPRSEQQRELLARALNLPATPPPELPIQVGVYRDTPRALRQLEQRQAQITALGIPVEQHRLLPGQPGPGEAMR